jgi:hypothetical protein
MDTEFDPTAYADVVPVPDDDGPDPPAPIAYSPQCACLRWADWSEWQRVRVLRLVASRTHSFLFPKPLPAVSAVMGVFRALFAAREASPRALTLCSQAIAMNPANYTAW